jgi:carbon monoxide dehydrogenase subunit G
VEFENSFAVKAPIAEVWDVLIDVERAAPCMPGAKVLERSGDDEYVVGMRVKVGPITMEYKGNVQILEKDPVAYRAVISGSGRELRGQGAAEARAEMVLVEEAGDTVATIKTDVKLSGRIASMGQGVIVDVTKRMVDAFSANLAAMLAAPQPGAAAPTAAPGDGTSVPGDETSAPAHGAGAGADASTAPREAPVVPATRAAAPAQETALPLMSIVGPVLVNRLRSPRVAVPVGVAVAALIAFLVWLSRR